MHSFQHYDLLEIKQADSPMSIIKLYLSQKVTQRIREFFIIFINAFSSHYVGRCYLLQRKDIVNILINIIFNEGNQDTSLRQNALGALQKFSLRRDA